MIDAQNQNQRLERTAEIVAAYVSRNAVPAAEHLTLLHAVPGAVSFILQDVAPQAPPKVQPVKPAVPINKSVTHEFIVCLEKGRRFKSLKRQLSAYYGLSPEAYRTKWGLPSDYPMVAPAYASRRSALARQTGLGKKPEDRPAVSSTVPTSQAQSHPARQPSPRRTVEA